MVKGRESKEPPKAGESVSRGRVHVLESSGVRPLRSGDGGRSETSILVQQALAGSRRPTPPGGLRSVAPSEDSMGASSAIAAAVAAATATPPSPAPPSPPASSEASSALAAAVTAATATPAPVSGADESSALAAAVAAATDLPSRERGDRRTHPLGWAVEEIESQPLPPREDSSPGEPAAADSVEARAIVEATTVVEQPGADEQKKEEESRFNLFLLALAAVVLILYVFWVSGTFG